MRRDQGRSSIGGDDVAEEVFPTKSTHGGLDDVSRQLRPQRYVDTSLMQVDQRRRDPRGFAHVGADPEMLGKARGEIGFDPRDFRRLGRPHAKSRDGLSRDVAYRSTANISGEHRR